MVDLVVYGSAAVAFGIAAYLAIGTLGGRSARWFVGALVLSALWGAALAYEAVDPSLAVWLPSIDAVHAAAWVGYLAVMLIEASEGKLGVRLGRTLFGGGVVVLGAALFAPIAAPDAAAMSVQLVRHAPLVLALFGVFGLEQVFRNSDFKQRELVKWWFAGLGAIFAIDIFAYSQSLLYGEISPMVELSRGVVNLAAVPLIMAASRSRREWQPRLFVSRHVVLYTTSLISAAFYLLAMAVAAQMVAASGHEWGPALEVLFLVSAGALFLHALFSPTLRMHLRVLVAKHFFRSRYDYREEWLRLIHTLAGRSSAASLRERSVKALADIVGSPRGELWVKSETGTRFDAYGTWGTPVVPRALEATDPLVGFLERTRWIIDTKEYAKDPEKYMHAFAHDSWLLSAPAVFVPLLLDNTLIGVVRLHEPPFLGQLGFEDHDLLKTAGQQVAIFLAQERAQEALALAQQFEAFNKLTSFLMHDLKNLITQQELVVGNAHRFKHRPEFVEDVIDTIAAGVRRMKSVLERLQTGAVPESVARIDVKRLIGEVLSSCSDRVPVAVLVHADAEPRVTMNRDKLGMAITHAIRNAQDATPQLGSIELRLLVTGRTVCIEIKDTGIGMDPGFVRDHLFKPFDSTKGTKGMGIGAYQIRETLRAAGGDVEVESSPGKGTVVRMLLPAGEALPGAERSVA